MLPLTFRAGFVCVLCLLAALPAVAQSGWKPAPGPLMTRWAAEVSPDDVHPEYPRPQMVRAGWQNLNGLWDYAVTSAGADAPSQYAGQILVPFPIESALSGVGRRLSPGERLWYRRTFDVPAAWRSGRVLLHFGAVDWEAAVYVNGREVGLHRGGYDPFSFDVTDALRPGPRQEVAVRVFDPTDAGDQPRGKQVEHPEEILYTPSSGIWQTVWLEPVPEAHIVRLKMRPDAGSGRLNLEVLTTGAEAAYEIEAVAIEAGRAVDTVRSPAGRDLELHVPHPRLWSPDEPFLYDLAVRLRYRGEVVDEVSSYFGLRDVTLAKDERGINRLFLNGKPLFQFGPLDQGYWPDGLYTAPTDEALRYDLEITKALGFNLSRKHIKVEPARWYYHADRMGLLVWQDMPNGSGYAEPATGDLAKSDTVARQFEQEMRAMVDALYNHPSVVMWVVFNEGWGQYDTARLTDWLVRYDTTRLVNNASGWVDVPGAGHVRDVHVYPGPAAPPAEPDRAVVLGEYGGLGLPVRGHLWQPSENWGYRTYRTPEELETAYRNLIRKLRPLVHTPGLAAAVYTQITDVEGEVNGFLTYDRAVLKLDQERLAELNRLLYQPPPPPPFVRTLLPTGQLARQTWRYTLEEPAEDWTAAEFDDAGWKTGAAPFGNGYEARDSVRTPWTTGDVWLRRTFRLDDPALEFPQIVIRNDGAAEIYINGRMVEGSGWTGAYTTLTLSPDGRAALRRGENVIAVHVTNNEGAQFIDVGLIDLIEQPTSTR